MHDRLDMPKLGVALDCNQLGVAHLVDLPCGQVVVLCECDVQEPLVVAQIKVHLHSASVWL